MPAGWTGEAFSGRQRLSRLTFKLAGDAGELRPDADRTVGGRRVLVWEVDGLTGLQQVCEYGATLAKLRRPVNGKVARCEVVLAGTKPGDAIVSAKCE